MIVIVMLCGQHLAKLEKKVLYKPYKNETCMKNQASIFHKHWLGV